MEDRVIRMQREDFFHWLVNKISNKQMMDFYMASLGLNAYGVEKHLCQKSIFELTSVTSVIQFFQCLEEDRIFQRTNPEKSQTMLAEIQRYKLACKEDRFNAFFRCM